MSEGGAVNEDEARSQLRAAALEWFGANADEVLNAARAGLAAAFRDQAGVWLDAHGDAVLAAALGEWLDAHAAQTWTVVAKEAARAVAPVAEVAARRTR